MTGQYKIAADIGGTFTDIALQLADGGLATRKVPSTPDNYARGVILGILELLEKLHLEPAAISEVLHSCTVATNAILEHKGARTALVTTRGFRDVLELRRIRVPRLYDPLYEKPEPLAPRYWRFEVDERIAADGSVVTPLDEAQVEAIADRIATTDVEAVAICLLHSHVNSSHELKIAQRLKARLPGRFITASAEILPEIREYERTSTTVLNAYVGPPVKSYIEALVAGLREAGIDGRLLVMQSSGGTLDADAVMQQPARIVECGPAAGVIGVAHHAARCGYDNVISFDMGGTTAKASLIEAGQLTYTDEYEVGGGISLSSRLVKGGGYALKLPVIDISEVGAGGGSQVWFDRVGALKVGPQSAGAAPGPACYGTGGTIPTVTDANVVLGYLNPTGLAGAAVRIDAQLAQSAIRRHVAERLGFSPEKAAWWIYALATTNMVRAVKAVSTYRGRNPTDFTLAAFGGNGGIFAAELVRHMQMRRALVPPAAGVFSAVGLCVADVQFNRTAAFHQQLSTADFRRLQVALGELADDVTRRLAPAAVQRVVRKARLRYVGQGFELPVLIPEAPDGLCCLRESFESEYERTYGHRLGGAYEVEIVALDVTAFAAAAPAEAADAQQLRETSVREHRRPAYFGPEYGFVDTPVTGRNSLPTRPAPGPWIVEEYEGTTVVPPDATLHLDRHLNIVIDLPSEVRP
jgi:N-methylhydantoinase A